MSELDQEQELGEGVIFTDNALLHPFTAYTEELREQPLLQVVVIVSEIFLQRSLRKMESDLLLSVVLEVDPSVKTNFELF
ncbi:MAG: hypothetical protein V1792_19905 [Pseudomonadota bacterium]